MSSTWEELKFYGKLARTLVQPRYDLMKVPGPKGTFALGHIPDLMRPDYHVQILQWANQYGPIFKFCLGYQYVVVVSDPAIAAQVLGRGQTSIPRKCVGYQFFDMATNHLGLHSFFTTSDEAQWQTIRKAAAPAFSISNVRKSFPHALHHAKHVADTMASHALDTPMEVQEHLELMLLHVFVEALFGIRPDDFPGKEVSHAMSLVLEEANQRLKMPLRALWQWMVDNKTYNKLKAAQKTLGQVYSYLYDVIRERDEPPEEDTTLWACLARAKHYKTGKLYTREQLLPEIGAFMMAGFDTSSHTIAWCLFTAATHPDVQAKLQQELDKAGLLHGPGRTPRELQFEDLARLEYLNAFMDETMRMFPVAATASVREVTQPTKVGPYTIPPGVIVWPMLYALHNANHNWDAPDKFLPERWRQQDATASFSSASSDADSLHAHGSNGGSSQVGNGHQAMYDGISHTPPNGQASAKSESAAAAKKAIERADATTVAASTSMNGVSKSGTAGQAQESNNCSRSLNSGKPFIPFSDGMKNCLGQNLGLMEVRTVLITLLSRFWFELDPAMGGPEAVVRDMIMSLTLKMKRGLSIIAKPLDQISDKAGHPNGSLMHTAAVEPAGPLQDDSTYTSNTHVPSTKIH